MNLIVRCKDGSGSGSDRISADFGSADFGFDVWFSPMGFWVRILEM
jgi:hypothetical protein